MPLKPTGGDVGKGGADSMDRGVSSPDSVSTNSTTVAVGAEPVSKMGLAAVVIVITTVSRRVESAR